MKMKSVLVGLALISSISVTRAQVESYYDPDDRETLQAVSTDYTDIDEIAAWCQDRLFTLRKAQRKASQESFRGKYAEAVKTLIKGLSSAATNGFELNPPITQRMIVRGVTLGMEINARVSSNVRGLKGTVHFLESYYDLINDVANRIDVPYYEPGRCGYCNYDKTMEMESALLEVVNRQVNLANEHLLVPGTVMPLGPSDLYLKAAEMLTYFANLDLRNSLHANYYACQIRDIYSIHKDLLQFNRSFQSEGEKVRMIYTTYSELNEVSEALSGNQRCHR